ncbi:MAG: transporter [Flavobacteriales bacterium]|nr:transporter [Flavobacteriales bacterium]
MRTTILLLLFANCIPFNTISAQGCSDAGVCTAGPIGQLHTDSAGVGERRNYAKLTFSYAVGEQSTTIVQVIPEIGFGITDRFGVQLKVPYISASGNLGDNSGVGDVIATVSYAFIKEKERNVSGMLGVRLPTGSTDANAPGIPVGAATLNVVVPFPMPYQTGLGTTDLLMGINARHGRWVAALAYQHVFSNANNNRFTHASWLDDENASKYFESNLLERKDDAVARIQYSFPVGKLALQPGLLGIMHLAKDRRSPTGDEADRVDIDGSDGLTLNLTVDARYRLTDALALEAAYGSPLAVRETRPDGLTRSFVLTVGLRYAF